MSGHSPGPWVVMPRKYDGLAVEQDAVAGLHGVLRLICRLNTFPPGRDHEANARLIAAAPDLLASLRKTLAAANELHGQGIGCPDCPDDHEETGEDCPMLAAAEAAIAKAEGR